MKNINKFSKLAVLFTALYYFIASLMPFHIYSIPWIYKIHIGANSFMVLVDLSLIIVSVVFGIISIIKIFKKGGAERWLIIAITLWNILMFLYSFIIVDRLG